MKNKLKHIFFASALMAAATNFTACSLDEVNPGEFTMDSLAETEETYEKIINNCYFAMERYFYGPISVINRLRILSGFGFMLVHHLIPLILTIFGVVFMMVLVPVI